LASSSCADSGVLKGIAPAHLSHSPSRYPLRRLPRSGVRSQRPAPIFCPALSAVNCRAI